MKQPRKPFMDQPNGHHSLLSSPSSLPRFDPFASRRIRRPESFLSRCKEGIADRWFWFKLVFHNQLSDWRRNIMNYNSGPSWDLPKGASQVVLVKKSRLIVWYYWHPLRVVRYWVVTPLILMISFLKTMLFNKR
jgi:hypothetical protein